MHSFASFMIPVHSRGIGSPEGLSHVGQSTMHSGSLRSMKSRSRRIPQYPFLSKRNRLALTYRLEGPEAVCDLEVGHKMGLLILFDRAAATQQSLPLKLSPGTVRNREYADWAKTEAITLRDILHILEPQLCFDGACETLSDAL